MALSGERRAKRSEISPTVQFIIVIVTLFQVSPPISAQRQPSAAAAFRPALV
jgi:hypothetical protein